MTQIENHFSGMNEGVAIFLPAEADREEENESLKRSMKWAERNGILDAPTSKNSINRVVNADTVQSKYNVFAILQKKFQEKCDTAVQ